MGVIMHKTGFKLSVSLLATTCACAAFAPAAAAQDNAAAQSPDDGGLDVIIVSAQKRPEDLQDTPISVTAISGEALDNLKLVGASQIAQQVPNLAVQTPFGEVQPIFSLRGVSLVDYSQHQQGPIAMYVDEGYKGAGVFRAQQLYDIERIEVLRGPQGTLFGRNTTGGAVNIYTVQPDLAGTEGYLTVGFGNYNLREATGALELTAIDDVLGVRVAFDARRNDGYLKAERGLKDFANEDGYAFRVSTAFHPTQDIRFNLTYSHSRSDTRPAGYTVKDIGEDGVGWAGIYNEGFGFYDVGAGDQGYLEVENDSVMLRGEFDLTPGMTLTSLSSWDKGNFSAYSDDDSTPYNILADGSDADAEVWAQELRLSSTDRGPFTWLVGASYSDETIDTSTRYDSFGSFSEDIDGTPSCFYDYYSGCVYTNAFSSKRRSWSTFGHLTYEIMPGFELQGGLRYSNDRTRINDYQAWLGYFDPQTGDPVYGVYTLIDGAPVDRFTNENVSGKIAASYELTADNSIYASYSRGYRAGSFNGYAYFDPSEVSIVKPEIVDAFEIGSKNEFLNRKLRLNAAVYYYKYRNQQFLDVTDEGLEVLVNAPRSRIWGAELEAQAQVTPALRLSAAAGYTNAKFQELTLSGVDLSGNRLSSAPRWTLNGALDWTPFEGTAGEFTLHADARYTGLQYFDAFNAPTISQPSFWLVNGRIVKPVGDSGLKFGAWVKNAFDKRYYSYLVDYQVYMNANLATPAAPRTYGVDVTLEF